MPPYAHQPKTGDYQTVACQQLANGLASPVYIHDLDSLQRPHYQKLEEDRMFFFTANRFPSYGDSDLLLISMTSPNSQSIETRTMLSLIEVQILSAGTSWSELEFIYGKSVAPKSNQRANFILGATS